MIGFMQLLLMSLALKKALSTMNATPQLIHISFGSKIPSMVVVWSTGNHTDCHVQYDVTTLFTNSVNGSIATLEEDKEKALSFLHRAELKDLRENETYFYQVACDGEEGTFYSQIHHFKTLTSKNNQPVNVLVYGDMGVDAGKLTMPALTEDLATLKYQAILHNGDLGYDLQSDSGAVGDNFLKMIEPIAARFPYMTSPGNHELSSDLHHYRHRFSMPGTPWPMPFDKLWYSFDIGPVHFISFSTEQYFIHNQDYTCIQYDWLLKDLTAANENRHNTPWIIAMGHRPMYCSNSNLDDCTPHFWGQWVKAGLEDLFYGMGVDLVIEAHEHSYERLWPVYQSDVVQHDYINPRAPVHIISGAGGNGEGVDWMGSPSDWSAFRADKRSKNSYGRLSVINQTHLYFEQVNAITKEVLDNFTLIQEHHKPFLSNIDCKSKHSSHKLCTCPPPFHYVTVAIGVGLGLCLSIAVSILLCYYSCSCCSSCCCWCCNRCTGNRFHTSGRHYKHKRLDNHDSELTLNLQSEESDFFDTENLL